MAAWSLSMASHAFTRSGNALIEADGQALFLRELEVQVHAERPRCQRTHLANLPPHRVDLGAPGHQHAEPAGVADCRRKDRTDCATHRSLDDREINAEAFAQDRLHAVPSECRLRRDDGYRGCMVRE